MATQTVCDRCGKILHPDTVATTVTTEEDWTSTPRHWHYCGTCWVSVDRIMRGEKYVAVEAASLK